MIRTSDDLFFVQPLPAHLAKRVRRSADTTPHLIYRLSPRRADAPGCQTKASGLAISLSGLFVLGNPWTEEKQPQYGGI